MQYEEDKKHLLEFKKTMDEEKVRIQREWDKLAAVFSKFSTLISTTRINRKKRRYYDVHVNGKQQSKAKMWNEQ